jgi:hypothetical protein
VEAVEKFEAYQDFLKYEYIRLHSTQFSQQVFANRYLDFLNQCQEKILPCSDGQNFCIYFLGFWEFNPRITSF